MFKVRILNPNRVVYKGDVSSVSLPGDYGVFEVLEFHKPIMSLLRQGEIIIDQEKSLTIRKGIAKMDGEELVVLIED